MHLKTKQFNILEAILELKVVPSGIQDKTNVEVCISNDLRDMDDSIFFQPSWN